MFPNDYKTYLAREVTTNGLTNAFFNGLACWYLMKDKGDLIWWGAHSFGVDILATAFILPWIVALILIPLQNMKVRKGKVNRWMPGHNDDHFMLQLVNRFPQKLWLNAILFGFIGMLFVAPLVLLVLFFAGTDTLTPEQYTYIKGAWTGILAALLTTPMILLGLRDKTPSNLAA